MKLLGKLFNTTYRELWVENTLYRVWGGFAWLPVCHPFTGKWFWLQRIKIEEMFIPLWGSFGIIDITKESDETYAEEMSRLERERGIE